MSNIEFFFEDIDPIKLDRSLHSNWLTFATEQEEQAIESLNYILCSDEHLYNINVQYLNHDYYTDVITFDNSDGEGDIDGDIFISLDRVSENANHLGIPLHEELRRIMIHGLLHLVGYNDKTPEEKSVMTEKENAYLSLPQFQF